MEGISVCVKGSDRIFKGALLAFLADNLASNELGGFKLSFSFSFRCCRTCLVPHDEMSQHFNTDNVVKRTQSTHEYQCEQLEGPAKAHYSKTYGINRKSALLDVSYYSLFGGGLPHDVMHDILEGVGPIEVKFLLQHCISEKYFTLDEYNKALVHFNYGYTECDKPVPIVQRHFQSDKPIRSSASQMLLLLHILPFLIGEKVPETDEYWKCFLLLRKIVDIVLSPTNTKNDAASLKLLIEDHHIAFTSLYPNSFIPKMHFLIHYPEQMLLVGPMVRTWTIRHEAKLNLFKQASGLSSFKNITLSLANHHQRWMCYEMATNHLLRSKFECGPPTSVPTTVSNQPDDIKHQLVLIIPNLSMDLVVSRPRWVRQDNVLYKDNNAYLIVDSDGLDPVFARVDGLLVIGGDMVLFQVRLCDVYYFDDHYHAYVLNVTHRQSLIKDILDRNVYHCHKLSNGLSYVTLKNSFK